jgi:hypothetical protein
LKYALFPDGNTMSKPVDFSITLSNVIMFIDTLSLLWLIWVQCLARRQQYKILDQRARNGKSEKTDVNIIHRL